MFRSGSVGDDEVFLPETFGQVLYRSNAESPKQLYIVGISHKDTLTGLNSPHTPRVEAEIYQIGAWLAREKGVELLLPEGFFAAPGKSRFRNGRRAGSESAPVNTDMILLERLLSEGSTNAETLLRQNFDLLMRQVEVDELYRTVHEGIRQLSVCTNLQEHFLIRSELNYHQERRVGAMLQAIPVIVNEAIEQGQVKEGNAVFTIGLSHIPSILRFLNEKKVEISCPLFTSSGARLEECSDELNLAKEGFGVTVILPRVLADDPKVLKKNKIKA